ncbi:SH3 domain-containing protein [Tepidamorphus sp. 3E244]|uniref:SH3 domain-containing protein n=1 Tax=Tepidamorphus sp. 3E244 TaxID=3385498 RepID=UPI0038FC9A8E
MRRPPKTTISSFLRWWNNSVRWRWSFAIALTFVAWVPVNAIADDYYVTANSLNVRLCPATSCPATNKLYRGQKVELFQSRDGWARISEFYDASVEKAEFPEIQEDKVARWVSAEFLSRNKPTNPEPAALSPEIMDPRIKYVPGVGDYGLTKREVVAMRRFALKLLKDGSCTAIVNADKSVGKAGQYYVQCEGENRSRYFRLADVE